MPRVLGSRAFKRAGVALLVANVLLFGWSLFARRAPDHSALWDGWVTNLQLLVPTLACVARAILGGPRRAGAAWLAAAMLSFTVASVIFVGWTQFQTDPPIPSPADIGYLVFYPCVIAAVFCLLRRDPGAPAARVVAGRGARRRRCGDGHGGRPQSRPLRPHRRPRRGGDEREPSRSRTCSSSR